jgi:hypothetical protein
MNSEFSKQVARGNWDIPLITSTLLREGCNIEFNASDTTPLRALRNDLTIFGQLLLLLVRHNILPSSHTSDATMQPHNLQLLPLQIQISRILLIIFVIKMMLALGL